LLPNKRRQTYEKLFSEIRNAIILFSGSSIGAVHTVMMDFETAAHEAVRNSIPGVRTRGCTFHFGQCLLRWIHQNGLKAAYEEEATGLKRYVGFLKSLVFLPQDLVLFAWNHWLSIPPTSSDPVVNENMTRFTSYFFVSFCFIL